jgi:hypothetical protein
MTIIFLLLLMTFSLVINRLLKKAKDSLDTNSNLIITDLNDKEDKYTTFALIGFVLIAGLFQLLKINHLKEIQIIFGLIVILTILIIHTIVINKYRTNKIPIFYIRKYLFLMIFRTILLISFLFYLSIVIK